jgi:hypothetical protein
LAQIFAAIAVSSLSPRAAALAKISLHIYLYPGKLADTGKQVSAASQAWNRSQSRVRVPAKLCM